MFLPNVVLFSDNLAIKHLIMKNFSMISTVNCSSKTVAKCCSSNSVTVLPKEIM